MKLTKSQLKELIKHAIVEESDIMNKDIKNPETKKRLKRALDYAVKRKEASKEKTKRLNKKK